MTAILSFRSCRVAGAMWGFPSLPSHPTHILAKRCSPQQWETMCIRTVLCGVGAPCSLLVCASLLAKFLDFVFGSTFSCAQSTQILSGSLVFWMFNLLPWRWETSSLPPMSDGFFVGFFDFGGGEIATQAPHLTSLGASTGEGRLPQASLSTLSRTLVLPQRAALMSWRRFLERILHDGPQRSTASQPSWRRKRRSMSLGTGL